VVSAAEPQEVADEPQWLHQCGKAQYQFGCTAPDIEAAIAKCCSAHPLAPRRGGHARTSLTRIPSLLRGRPLRRCLFFGADVLRPLNAIFFTQRTPDRALLGASDGNTPSRI
jgi:hypothetical protein